MEFLILFSPILLVILIYIGQTFLGRKVSKIMRTKSGFQINPSSNVPVSNALKSRQTITFEEKSYFWGNIKDTSQRKNLIKRSRTRLKKSLYFNLAAGIGYILFPALFLYLNSQDQDKSSDQYYFLGTIFILYHLFRYDVFVNEITLEEKHGKDYFGIILRVLYGIIGFLVNLVVKFLPKSSYIYPIIFSMFFFGFAGFLMVENSQVGIGLLIAFALHIYLQFRLFKWVKSLNNYKLLILRVFNLESSTKFTFTGIWKYWKYIGSYLTVVDSSLLNLQKRKIWTNLIPILILVMLFETLLSLLLKTIGIELGVKNSSISYLLITIGLVIYFIYSYKQLNQSFIGNQNDLDRYILQIKKRPVNILATFRGHPVRCFDNTWSYVVSEFVQIADVILMDLRGYSESNKGCQKEVNHLLNLVPISKVTFLVGEGDLSKVKNLIDESCQNMSVTSPNYYNEVIQINLYVMIGVKKVQYLNTLGIIAELLHSISINENP